MNAIAFHDKSMSLNWRHGGGLFHSNVSEIPLCHLRGTEQDLGEDTYLTPMDGYTDIRISASCLGK